MNFASALYKFYITARKVARTYRTLSKSNFIVKGARSSLGHGYCAAVLGMRRSGLRG